MKEKPRYMKVLGGYELDMRNHGHLVRHSVNVNKPGDFGADPLPNGMFKMVPSGDVVTAEEKSKRLAR